MTIDDPSQAVNTANENFRRQFPELLDQLEKDRDSITGVILTSAKRTFFAGADLASFATAGPEDVPAVHALLDDLKAGFRRLETLGVPVVAAINGAALGGGCELSLACHYRVAVDRPDVLIGLPEVSLGLLPGAGGIVRTVRMFGLAKALELILIPGTRFSPGGALEVGLVDELVGSDDDLVPAARRWLAAGPLSRKPWDERGYRIPGGSARDPETASMLALLPAKARKKTRGAPSDAVQAIVSTAVESTLVDFGNAQRIESRYCAQLVGGQVSSNIIKGTFFDVRSARARSRALTDGSGLQHRRVLILGDNPMGRGIEKLCQDAGLDTVVVDGVDDAITGHFDVLIETMFSDLASRTKVLSQVSELVGAGTAVATNSSWTALADLADHVADPSDLVGFHLFAPVDRMELAEIAIADTTNDHAKSVVVDLARAMNKTSIVVGGAAGFYANRVLAAFLGEALRLLSDGVSPAAIEQAAYQAGFPSGVLRLADAIGLPELRELIDAVTDHAADSDDSSPRTVLDTMVGELDRTGQVSGRGFYDYPEARRGHLWQGLQDQFAPATLEVGLVEIQERLLFAGALEAAACLDRKILHSVAEGNVGSILGVGYPIWTGGAVNYIQQYAGGPEGFAERARILAQSWGRRFDPAVLTAPIGSVVGAQS
ncbi:enoyl-CoA hydratase/isomerase family protein [Mycolicibacterium chitae]|uniref:enoyl-CoA hydratase-related protein n=1 Tax=Mycolicibacterium chitae TaxID=1792 RepID=UPI00147709CD|nr:enoyl-CoA hydratase-related protein [Mycolicibacterium chitae]MCV7104987.1 enoyl-CoA hydratase/isomerase family protein [Mycolicibacterium chitae]